MARDAQVLPNILFPSTSSCAHPTAFAASMMTIYSLPLALVLAALSSTFYCPADPGRGSEEGDGSVANILPTSNGERASWRTLR